MSPTSNPLLTEWYPTWYDGDHTCLNDGNAPAYSEQFVTLRPFYCSAKTDALRSLALRVSPTLVPFSTVTNTGNFIHSTLENCCNAYYAWNFTNCMILGGATSATYATNKFYVDYISLSCRQSCEVGTTGLNCKGLAPKWVTLFANAESCCEEKLWWLGASTCVAD